MNQTLNKTGGFTMLVIIACRNIWRNSRRTGMCVAAVAIAVFFTIFVQSMLDGMTKSVEDVVQIFDTGHVTVVSKSFDDEKESYPVQYPVEDGRSTAELIRDIKTIPGVVEVLPRIIAYATISESVVKHALLWGINIEEETAFHPFNLTEKNNGLKEGRFPAPGTNECAIGVYMAKKAGLHIGDKIQLKTVSAQFSDKFWSPEIVGLFEFNYRKYDEDVIMVSFERLQKILVMGDGTQQLLIYADGKAQSRSIASQVKKMMDKTNITREWSDNYWVAVMQQSTAMFIVISLVFQIVASFLIINTVVMIIQERIKEIGMMGSLGLTRWEITAVFFFEAIFLSVIGALAGCIIGGLVTGIGSHFPLGAELMGGTQQKETPMASAVFLAFSFKTILQGFLFGVVIASICTFIPSAKCAFIEPVDALRQ